MYHLNRAILYKKNPRFGLSPWYNGVMEGTVATGQRTHRVGGEDEPVYHRKEQPPSHH